MNSEKLARCSDREQKKIQSAVERTGTGVEWLTPISRVDWRRGRVVDSSPRGHGFNPQPGRFCCGRDGLSKT